MEYCLLSKKKKSTKAMKARRVRHEKLEQEVVRRVKVHDQSKEDRWALRFINFIVGTNQLLFEGLTRELPLLQLMCYKVVWDTSVGNRFPSEQFFDYFQLDGFSNLSEEIVESAANAGSPAKNLDELVRSYISVCEMLPLAHDELLLRYEPQKIIHFSERIGSPTITIGSRVKFIRHWSSGPANGKLIMLRKRSVGNVGSVNSLGVAPPQSIDRASSSTGGSQAGTSAR